MTAATTAYPYAVLLDRERWQLESLQRALGELEQRQRDEAQQHALLVQARADIATRLGRAVDAGLDPAQARNRMAFLAHLDARLMQQERQLAQCAAACGQAREAALRQQLRIESLQRHRTAHDRVQRRVAVHRDETTQDAAWLERAAMQPPPTCSPADGGGA